MGIFTTSTQSVTTTCTYSTAALAACPTRKRRGITADEDDEEVIDASAVESVVPTQAAEITDSREKRQYLADYDVNAALQSSYYFDPQNAGSVEVGKLFFGGIQTVTSTSTTMTTVKSSSLVTCAPAAGTPYGTC